MKLALAIIGALLVFSSAALCESKLPEGPFASRDFVQYWSACKIIEQRGNPYDAAQMLAVQRGAGFRFDQAVMMWNPPWMASIFCPLMPDSLSSAAAGFAVLNILMHCAASMLFLLAVTRKSVQAIAVALACVIFVPSIDCMLSGQNGILLALALAAFSYFKSRKRAFLSGLALSLLSIKPHLFLLLFAAIIIELFKTRELKTLAGAALGWLVLFVPIWFWDQNLLSEWVYSLIHSKSSDQMTAILDWQPDALVGVLRRLSFNLTGSTAPQLVWLLPCAGLAVTCAFLFKRSAFPNWQVLLPYLVLASFIFAPYGWFSDQAVLLVIPATLLGLAPDDQGKRESVRLLTVLLAAQAALAALSPALGSWWFPVLYLFLYYCYSTKFSLAK